MQQPLHIQPKWFAFTARVQGLACQQNGHAIITIKVLVDASGSPVLWSEPKLVKLEPLSGTQQWIGLLSDF